MEGVDEGTERSEAGLDRLDMRRREQMQPGQEQTGTDVGLEQEPEGVERVLPAGAGVPGGMGLHSSGRRELGGTGRRGRHAPVAEGGEGRALQADERVGAHDQFPPAR